MIQVLNNHKISFEVHCQLFSYKLGETINQVKSCRTHSLILNLFKVTIYWIWFLTHGICYKTTCKCVQKMGCHTSDIFVFSRDFDRNVIVKKICFELRQCIHQLLCPASKNMISPFSNSTQTFVHDSLWWTATL